MDFNDVIFILQKYTIQAIPFYICIMLKQIFFCLFSFSLVAQTIPVGMVDLAEERLRNQQLISGAQYSFTIRPVRDSVETRFLPISIQASHNLLAPMGYSDGAMVPARGLQTLFTGGVFLKYKALSFQFKPEILWAANTDFSTFSLSQTDLARRAMVYYLTTSDIPERLGSDPITQFYLGQSAIRLSSKSVSFGISTENLWWGPGFRNSLLMTNNAPGFLHATFNTVKPLKTFAGNVEFQLIAGKLNGSGLEPSTEEVTVAGVNYFWPKPQDWRYISGLSINYQPKWVPGLFLGFSRVFQLYSKDLGTGFSDYFPLFIPIQKKSTVNEDGKNRDQLASISARWVFPSAQLEIYGESGWNDYLQNVWDFFVSPDHSYASTIGLRKLFKRPDGKYIRVAIENTSLQMTTDRILRNEGSWYRHWIVRSGYTHQGQVIGAGIGPGGSSQTIDVASISSKRALGVTVERFAHNLDFFYDGFKNSDQKWVDLILGGYYQARYKDYGLTSSLSFAWIRNYQWEYFNHRFNMQAKLSVTRYF
jgi:hypothetical protein